MNRTGKPTEEELARPFTALSVIPGRRCIECHREVRQAPGGAVCVNGHGGYDEAGVSSDAVGNLPDQNAPLLGDPYEAAGVRDWAGADGTELGVPMIPFVAAVREPE